MMFAITPSVFFSIPQPRFHPVPRYFYFWLQFLLAFTTSAARRLSIRNQNSKPNIPPVLYDYDASETKPNPGYIKRHGHTHTHTTKILGTQQKISNNNVGTAHIYKCRNTAHLYLKIRSTGILARKLKCPPNTWILHGYPCTSKKQDN
jgi:hypothetical protein